MKGEEGEGGGEDLVLFREGNEWQDSKGLFGFFIQARDGVRCVFVSRGLGEV